MNADAMGLVVAAVAVLLLGSGVGAATADPLDDYNVAWDTPSADSSGSMPLGNGDIGLNVWAEPSGDVLFYIGKTDAWSENARLLKLGRVRVHLDPNPLPPGTSFSQTLQLRQGTIRVQLGGVALDLWVDANLPVIRIEAHGAAPVRMTATLEVWRTAARELAGEERNSAYGLMESPDPIVVTPDAILTTPGDRVVWYHRNRTSMWAKTLELQGMGDWIAQGHDPLLDRTFGGLLRGEGFAAAGDTVLTSMEARRDHRVCICALTQQTATETAWVQALAALADDVDAVAWTEARAAHEAWWDAFWNRSWIRVEAGADGATVTRGYVLQRFIAACAGRGAYPVKFNGSIFTVDAREPNRNLDADYRAWGGPYWFQNTRLVYWPMLASGDYDTMQPLFGMFLDALPFAQARTRTYFSHEGAFFPETQYFWGAYANDNYGWDRAGKPASLVDNRYIRWYWSGALELLAMMLDYQAYTGDAAFTQTKLLPLAGAVLDFYDQHYARDAAGKLHFEPAQGLETWQSVINPLPVIAGLQVVLDGLLALPEAATSTGLRVQWTRMRGELPPLPTREMDGGKLLAAAQEILEEAKNSENPELYAIFPYRLFGVSKPDLDMARRTFDQRRVKGNRGWQQDDTQAAFLGLAAEAAARLTDRFATKHAGSRFPAFWGPNFDWIPDQDHGSNGLMALETMLLQADGRKILLFPAWPKTWDVAFKLHAPYETIVEGVYRNGTLERLTITPEARAADVVQLALQE